MFNNPMSALIQWSKLLQRGGSVAHTSKHSGATKPQPAPKAPKHKNKKSKKQIGHKELKKRHRQHMAHLMGRKR